METGIAYGGKAGKQGIEIIRYANRAPLIFDQGGCSITEAVKSIDWKRYGIRDSEKVPLTIFINVVSTHVPYTSAGKQALAMEEEIFSEIRYSLMDSGRALSRFMAGKRKLYERKSKMNTLLRYVPETAAALSAISGKDVEKITKQLECIVSERYEVVEEHDDEEEEEMPQGMSDDE